jgi:metallophosphoesterase (TIGR00282 family)
MRILILGDIISKSGRRALKEALPALRERSGAELVIGNVENAAGLFGITEKVIEAIKTAGVDVLTSGNHVWDKREGFPLLEMRDDLLRPANYPDGVPGRGSLVWNVSGVDVCIINIQGRTFMMPIDCPFRRVSRILAELPPSVKVVIVDFHAEATSEKLAMGFFLDGRVSVLVGTHTHVQTADERILPDGTGYITDVGMVGPRDSIIGVKKEQVIDRFLYGIPQRLQVESGTALLNAVIVDVDEETGRARSIERISEEIEEG